MGKKKRGAEAWGVVAGVVVALGTGVALWLMISHAQRPLLVAACQPDGGRLLAIVGSSRSTDDHSWREGSASVFDVATGKRLSTSALGRWEDARDAPSCLGAAGPGRVWVREPGTPPEVGIVAVADDKRDVSFAALARSSPELAVGIDAVAWDGALGAPTLRLKDAREVVLDPVSGASKRYTGAFGSSDLDGGRVVRGGVVSFYVGGGPRLVTSDGKRMTFAGHPRSTMQLAGKALFADRDFYQPDLVLSPTTRAIDWVSPPGFVVVEETLIGSLTYRVTRIGLDGQVLFSFDPGEPLAPGMRYDPWIASADGSLLLHAGAEGLIAIDAVSGRERYRVDWEGKARKRK